MLKKRKELMNKKAQIAGQMFIYIMAIIVIGVIALVGYNAIKSTVNKSCQVEQLNFKSNLEQMIDRYNSYGSVNKASISAPCNYVIVCFVDAEQMAKDKVTCENNSIIENSVNDGAMQNIFVVSGKTTMPLGYSKFIRTTTTECLCVKAINNNFQLTFRGIGVGTQIVSS